MAQEGGEMAHGGEKEGHAQAQTLFLLRFPNAIINVKIRLILCKFVGQLPWGKIEISDGARE